MNTELAVIVPTSDNHGRTLQPEIDAWEAFLMDNIGGYTREAVQGAWRDASGRIVYDQSYRYTLTGEGTEAVSLALGEWCERLRQQVLYVTRREVETQFIAPVHAR